MISPMKENRFRFFTILLLYSLAHMCVVADEDDYYYDDDDSSTIDQEEERSFCGGVTDVSGELPLPTPAPASGKFPEADVSTYRPFRFLYILVGDWTETEQAILNKAFDEVNNRIGPIVRGPSLSEVRLARRRGAGKSKCYEPKCFDSIRIRGKYEFALPCTLENGTVVPDGSENYAPEVQEYNKDAKYSVVVFVQSPMDTHAACHGPNPLVAYASICQRGERNRPTHGQIVICTNVTSEYFANDMLRNMLLHESLHIAINDFDGHHFPSNPLVEQGEQDIAVLKEEARGKSWKWITLNWKTNESNIERKVGVAMTPNVLKYVKDEHFRCDSVEGAELSLVGSKVNAAHWSFRLFPDELMSPKQGGVGHLSKLTLGSMQDSTWFDVNMSLAEPLTVSRPQADGCGVAQKSCFELLRVNKSTDRKKVFLGHPYCHEKGRVTASLCSSDNKARLECNTSPAFAFNCSVRYGIVTAEPEYGHAFCQFAKEVPQRLKDKGLRAGDGSMCITFVDTEWAPPPSGKKKKKRLYPSCVAYTCDEGQLILQFHRENKPSCNITFTSGIHDNTLVQDPFPASDECAKLLSPMKLIAPEIRAVCPLEHAASTTPSSSNNAGGHYTSLWVTLVAICKLIKLQNE